MTAPYSLTVRGPSVVEEGANARSRPGLSGLRRSKNFTTENSENHGDARRFFEAAFIKSDQSTAFINDATQNNDATHGDYRLRPPIYRVGSSSCPRHPRAQPHTHRDKCRAEHDLRFVVILGLEPRIARITHHGRLSAPARVHGCSGRARAGRRGINPILAWPYLDAYGVEPGDDGNARPTRQRAYRWSSHEPLAAAGPESPWSSAVLRVLRGKNLRRSRTTAPKIQNGPRCDTGGVHHGNPVTNVQDNGGPS